MHESEGERRPLWLKPFWLKGKSGLLTVGNTAHRVQELCDVIDRMLDAGRVSAPELVSLKHRLLFAECQVFGRKSCRAMKVISNACLRSGSIYLGVDPKCTLSHLREKVLTGSPRTVRALRRNTYLLFADACFEDDGAGLGTILRSAQGLVISWFGEWIDPSLESISPDGKKTLTYELEAEATASCASLLHLCHKLADCDIIQFTDNEAVLANLISGKAENSLVLAMLESIFEWENTAAAHIWLRGFPARPIHRMHHLEWTSRAFQSHAAKGSTFWLCGAAFQDLSRGICVLCRNAQSCQIVCARLCIRTCLRLR